MIISLPGEWREWRVHGDTVEFLFLIALLEKNIEMSSLTIIMIMQVNFIKICQTNKILVTASRDGSFCIWDIVQVGKKYIPQPLYLQRLGKIYTNKTQWGWTELDNWYRV